MFDPGAAAGRVDIVRILDRAASDQLIGEPIDDWRLALHWVSRSAVAVSMSRDGDQSRSDAETGAGPDHPASVKAHAHCWNSRIVSGW